MPTVASATRSVRETEPRDRAPTGRAAAGRRPEERRSASPTATRRARCRPGRASCRRGRRRSARCWSRSRRSRCRAASCVSSRAKKPGVSAFTSTKAGRPTAKAASAPAVRTVSSGPKRPCSNSTRMMGSASCHNASGGRQAEQQAELDGAVLVGHRRLGVRRRAARGPATATAPCRWRCRPRRAAAARCGRRNRAPRSCRPAAARPRPRRASTLICCTPPPIATGVASLTSRAHPRGPARPHQRHADAVAGAGDQQPQPLQDAGDRHADRRGIAAVGQEAA